MRLPSLIGVPLLSGATLAAVTRSDKKSGTVPVTPHDNFSSSIGVLGCKINTNRVAYWPNEVDCTNICVSLKYEGREVHLLRIDHSGGAHDVSYDAWNYLYTGHSATDRPTAGGAIDMEYEEVDAAKCKDLIDTKGHKLPLSAANSMGFLASCLEKEDSWVANNYVLFNIQNPICTVGVDEKCHLDWPAKNQATCSHMLGTPAALEDDPVYNILYPSGKRMRAGEVDNSGGGAGDDDEGAASTLSGPRVAASLALLGAGWLLVC